MTIKPIETIYDGYKFRSRLEARWAVFFNTLGVPYEYEKEGFDLGELGWYLPDFWLPKQNCWIEIKGKEPTEEEGRRVTLLVKHTQEDAYIFFGNIPRPDDSSTLESDSAYALTYGEDYGEDKVAWDMSYLWCECPDCGNLGIEFNGRADRLSCKRCYYCSRILQDGSWTLYNYLPNDPWKKNTICPTHGKEYERDTCPRHGANFDKGYNSGSPRLIAAYTAARQARFEHGERGK